MKMMLMGVMPGLPKMWFPIVDVRDVAQAHLNDIKVPEAANKRFALCGDTNTFKELCEKIIEKYGDKYPTHTREMEECPPENFRFKNAWGHHLKLDNTRSTSILGIKYHDVKDTFVDMTEALISHSMIPDDAISERKQTLNKEMKNASASEARVQDGGRTERESGAPREPYARLQRPSKRQGERRADSQKRREGRCIAGTGLSMGPSSPRNAKRVSDPFTTNRCP
jgi:hypothetical protein